MRYQYKRSFWQTIKYIIFPPKVDMMYDDGCTGNPELDSPNRFR